MSLYRGRSRIELEIEKNRNEANWRKVSDLIYQLNIKNVGNDNLAAFLKNECSLEQYLEDNAPNEKNIKKATNNLTDIKISLYNLINSNYVKANQSDILFESDLLLAKIYYACGNEQDVMNIYTNLDLNKTWMSVNSSIRTLGLVAELYAMNAFCLERKPPSFISNVGEQYNSDDEDWLSRRNSLNTETSDLPENHLVNNNNSPPSIFSSSYKRQLEQSCRDNWHTQIVNDLKLAIIYGYSYLQKKYNKVLSSTSILGQGLGNVSLGPGMNTAIGSGSLYGGYGLSVANASDIIGSPGDDTVSLRSGEKKVSRLMSSRERKNKKISTAKTKEDKKKKQSHHLLTSNTAVLKNSKGKFVVVSGSAITTGHSRTANSINLDKEYLPQGADKDVVLLDNGADDNIQLSTFPQNVPPRSSVNNSTGFITAPTLAPSFQSHRKGSSSLTYGKKSNTGTTEFDYDSDLSEDNNTYPSPPSGYVLEKAFLKLPIIFLKSGQIDKAIIVYRYQLSLMETKYTQNIRQVLCRQLAEVLIKGVSHSTYIPIQYSDIALNDNAHIKDLNLPENLLFTQNPGILPKASLTSITNLLSPRSTKRDSSINNNNNHQYQSKLAIEALTAAFMSPSLSLSSSSSDPTDRVPLKLTNLIGGVVNYPARHDLPKSFSPRFMENEILLIILVCRSLSNSFAILSLAPEHEEARLITAEDISRVSDLLSLTLTFGSSYDNYNNGVADFNEKSAANLRRYKYLTLTLEHSLKFNPERFHTWYRYAFSLLTFALSSIDARSCSGGGYFRHLGYGLNSQGFMEPKGASHAMFREKGELYRALRAFEECHSVRPDNITVILLLSRVCLEGLGDIDKGIDYALMAIDLCGSQQSTTHNNSLSLSNNASSFGEHFNATATSGYPTLQLAKAYNALGYGYFYKSRKTDIAYSYVQRVRYIQLALENFKKALNLDPQNLDFAFNLALQHAILRQIPQATKLTELCLVTELTHFHACHLLVLLKTAPAFPASTAANSSARKLKQQTQHEINNVSDDPRRGGNEKLNLKLALELINSLLQQHPRNFNLYFTRAEIERKYYGNEMALLTYRKMLGLWKELRDKYFEKESEYHNLTKKCEITSKLDLYEKEIASSLYGGNPPSAKTDTALTNQSDVISFSTHASESNKPKEMTEFLMIQFQIWLKIAQLYLDQHMLEDAFFAIKEAEEISKTSYFILDLWGKFYMCLGDANTAKVYFESSLATNPCYIDALQDLSLAYFYLQNFEMAEIKIREALKIKPTSHRSWYYLGHIYHMNTNPDKDQAASDFYLTALDLYSSKAVRPYDILRPIF